MPLHSTVLSRENEELRARLQEAEEILNAIRSGAVDALVVSGDSGEQVFTLKGADHPYRLLIEEMSEGGLTLTEEGVILYANKRFGEMLQTPLEKVIGSSLYMWVTTRMQPILRSLLEPKDRIRREVDLDLRMPDGIPVATHCSLTALKIEDVPGYYCMVVTDLSEHQRAEEALQAESQARALFAESERSRRALLSLLEDETITRQRLVASHSELQALLAAMRDVVLVLDRNGTFCRIAPTSPNPLYHLSDSLLGKSLEDNFSPGQAEQFLAVIGEVLATGQKAQVDYCLPVAGQTLCFEASLSLMLDNRVLWVARDVTERMQAETALRESELHFRLLFEENPAVMLVIDPDSGDIKSANRAAAEFYGYATSELTTMNINAINQLPPEETRVERLRAARQERAFFVFPHRLASGEIRTVEVHSAPINLEGSTLLFSIVHDISERVRAEAEILSLAKFPGENPNPVMRISWDGILLYANQSSQPLLDFWQIGVNSEVPKDLQANVSKALQTCFFHEFELDCLGHIYSVTFMPFPGNDYVNVYAAEITGRKQAEAHIRYQAGLLDDVSDAIIATDMSSQITSWNSAATKIYGWCAGEVLGSSVASLLQTKYIDDTSQEQVLQQFLKDSLWRGEVTQTCKDGKTVTILASVALIRDEAGVPKGMVAVNRDITTRKQAEAQIRRQVKYLNALHMIDTAISSSFETSRILDLVLEEVQAQLGVDACAALLFNPQLQSLHYAASRGFHSDALHHTKVKLGEGSAGQAIATRQMLHISNFMATTESLPEMHMREQETFVDYYAIPLIVKGEVKGVLEIYHHSLLEVDTEWLGFLQTLAGQLAIAIDNAQLFENLQRTKSGLEDRVAERTAELSRTNSELEHANHIKDEFLANMSHELRTPLTSILGLSEALMEQRRGPLNEHQLRSLEVIESSGRHLLELINDILDLSKIEAGKFDYYPQSVRVEDICRSSLAFIKSQAAKKSIAVIYTNESRVSEIYADPRRLKQILVNLLTNAVKFTPQYGTLILNVSCVPDQEILRFAVIDTGIGISPENLKRLFQPFVQVDSGLNRQQDGTGLGLALVQRLTDLHGGSIEVESEIGKGSRFTINLVCKRSEFDTLKAAEPLMSMPVMTEQEKPEVPEDSPVKHGVILLAEDNLANVLTIGEYLESVGYEIVVAHDGFEALEMAETVLPDLILMDIQMPVLDGLQAIERLRANPHFISTPIIALTALAMPGDRERCLATGADEYLSKPVSLRHLLKKIQELLHSENE